MSEVRRNKMFGIVIEKESTKHEGRFPSQSACKLFFCHFIRSRFGLVWFVIVNQKSERKESEIILPPMQWHDDDGKQEGTDKKRSLITSGMLDDENRWVKLVGLQHTV